MQIDTTDAGQGISTDTTPTSITPQSVVALLPSITPVIPKIAVEDSPLCDWNVWVGKNQTLAIMGLGAVAWLLLGKKARVTG